jgi:hypothetical protein
MPAENTPHRIAVWNPTRRPGKAEDGPPYGKPGMWSPFSIVYPTRAAAEEGREELIKPWYGEAARDPEKYAVVPA